jgi:hypothetical protein
MDCVHEQLKKNKVSTQESEENKLAIVECNKEEKIEINLQSNEKMQIENEKSLNASTIEQKQEVEKTSEIEEIFGGSYISKVIHLFTSIYCK